MTHTLLILSPCLEKNFTKSFQRSTFGLLGNFSQKKVMTPKVRIASASITTASPADQHWVGLQPTCQSTMLSTCTKMLGQNVNSILSSSPGSSCQPSLYLTVLLAVKEFLPSPNFHFPHTCEKHVFLEQNAVQND